LQAVVSEHVAKVFLYGADADAIKTALAGFVTCAEFGSLAAVVDAIAAEVTPGSLVLFAPACASFDQFDNFEHRGREFKKLVKEAFL
jgi:UDP-N-acetylmuramoylalanine--D-glutamate ligase